MYLTRIRINPHRRTSRKLLGSPQAMHAAVLGSYMDAPEPTSDVRVLWRADIEERSVTLYVSSPTRPDTTYLREEAGWPEIPESAATVEYESFLDRLEKGQRWAFRLTANPVHHARRKDGEPTKALGHVTERHQRQWLLDRGVKHGMELDPETIAVRSSRTWQFARKDSTVSLRVATFDGILEVADVDALRRMLCVGIGRARGYGCGLMTLANLA